eukprot:CAMPEP_0196583654 /NCGR_PEP_ID=MMETSP1081-20130531/44227_1 /TAXON_ID=36882 /ORGANISM="Pyramimonas amylifera, Strain CCMP720" /LENGTH=310 /DNA_ID=CAMNT_0041904603 /DNA_START=52 /DNA_END=984 /DNA_ORIENTATION=+
MPCYSFKSKALLKISFTTSSPIRAGIFRLSRSNLSNCNSARSRKVIVRAENKEGENATDVVARLAAAEKEAEQLRQLLEQAQGSVDLSKQKPAKSAKRIDGTGGRETIFGGRSKSWLQEEDVAFFTGDGAVESGSGVGVDPEEQSTVTRRLLIGLAGIGAFAVLSQVPDSTTRPKPSKPLFFYLVPLIRIQALLPDLEKTVEGGDAESLRAALRSVQGSPNNVKDNLKNAAACLDDDRDFDRANKIAGELIEYVSQVDYTKYFDSVSSKVNERQISFSLNCVQAIEKKLVEFLAVMPRDQVEAARTQVSY